MAWDDYDDYDLGQDIWGSANRNASPNWNFTGTDAWSPRTPVPEPQQQRPDWLGSLGNFGLGRGMQSATPEAIAPQRRQLAPPQYDYGPMTRYQEYLKSEPERADYQPRGIDRLINAAAAGVRGFQTGDVGAGLKLGNELREQPYNEAFKRWQSKGGRYQADATMAETRNKNQEAAYQRDVTNAREDRRTAIDEQRLQMQLSEARDRGFQFRPGDDGKMVAYRIKDGKPEVIPTAITNDEYTLLEKTRMREEDRQDALTRHSTPSGSSLLAARTATANTAANIKSREGAYSYSHGSGNDVIDPRLPGDTNTPAKLLQAYGEFNDPNMISVSGGRAQLTPGFRKMLDDKTVGPDGKTKAEKFFQEKAARTGVPYDRLLDRWREFKTRVNPMLLPEEED